MQAVDTSVAIAALLSDHHSHDLADEALACSTTTIAHVIAETYSVLTRLPAPLRVPAADAARLIEARLPSKRVALDADRQAAAPSLLASAGVSGGATYDGMIGLTAAEHDLELLSLDRRAARAYRAVGVRFRVLGT